MVSPLKMTPQHTKQKLVDLTTDDEKDSIEETQLEITDAQNRMEQVKSYLKSIIHGHQGVLSKAKLTYFQRNLQE